MSGLPRKVLSLLVPVLALLLVAALLYVSVVPWLQLDPAALRAARAAILLLVCIQLSLVTGALNLIAARSGTADRHRRNRSVCGPGGPLYLHSAHLC